MYKTRELFTLSRSQAGEYLAQFTYPWQALSGINTLIVALGEKLSEEYREISPQVWIHNSAKIAPTAQICSPCIIGANTEVRHCAFIRGSALIGKDCVVGNSVEIKNAIVFDGVQIPHYNYVGDSILGYKAHMGAGAITSNVKGDKSFVCVQCGEEKIQTNLKKVGAMLGDYAEIGCNSVLNPGCVIGKNSQVYPLSSVRGTVEANSIYKQNGVIVAKN